MGGHPLLEREVVEVRRISVVDLQDFLSPPLTIEDYAKLGGGLDPERFRVVELGC